MFDGLVREVIRLAIPARTEEVTLEVALDAAEVEIACIVDEMQQVIRNLIQNAIDAVAEQGGGRVEVQTRCDAEYLLDVIDDGPGIPRELLASSRPSSRRRRAVKAWGSGSRSATRWCGRTAA